ncbi:MAG: hypothetical protein LBL46_01055 [Rickettsiales bacterium]|jgi:hypothetical protein|nr:hypothetical protein [Rickettsiales bacterium]
MFGATAARADAPVIATKGYVDSGLAAANAYTDNAYLEVAKNDNTLIPSWATLNSASYGAAWGGAWFVKTDDGSALIEGIATCLGNNSNADAMSQASVVGGKPNLSGWGKNCFCNVQRVNNQQVAGAWAFAYTFTSASDCYLSCNISCPGCVRAGTSNSCTRAKLLASP